jgi:hypothetical protein
VARLPTLGKPQAAATRSSLIVPRLESTTKRFRTLSPTSPQRMRTTYNRLRMKAKRRAAAELVRKASAVVPEPQIGKGWLGW